jgi:hypothetical protein
VIGANASSTRSCTTSRSHASRPHAGYLALTDEGSGAEDKGGETSGMPYFGVRVSPAVRYRIILAFWIPPGAAVP